MATRAKDHKPTRREVQGRYGDPYIVDIGERAVTIRPKGTRSVRVRVVIEWGAVYMRALTAQIEAERRAKRPRRVKR